MKGFVERSRLFIAALAVSVFGVGAAMAQNPSVSFEVEGFAGLTVDKEASGTVTFTLLQDGLDDVVFNEDAGFIGLLEIKGADVEDSKVTVDEDLTTAVLTLTVVPTDAGEKAFTIAAAGDDALSLVRSLDGEELELVSVALTGELFAADVVEAGDENTTGGGEETTPISISDADVSIAGSNVYSGSAITPEVTVSIDEKTLEQDIDYTLEFSDNVNAGTATVTVTGIGDYEGTVEETFEIAKKTPALSDFAYTIPVSGVHIDQTPYSLAVTFKEPVSDGSATLTVLYNGVEDLPEEVGSYAVTLVVSDGSNLEDGELALGAFDVIDETADIADAEVTVDGEYAYTGEAVIAEVAVVYGEVTLVLDVDYTLEFADNVNAGKATVTVAGKGVYHGTNEATFEIAKRTLVAADFDVSIPETHVYTGAEQGIGDVVFAAPIVDKNAVITVSYYAAAEGKDVEDGEGVEVAEGTSEGEEGEGVDEAAPVAPIEIGTYIVMVSVTGGENVLDAVIELGRYTIHDSLNVSVASVAREVPSSSVSEAAFVAPLKKAVAKFTVGPSPVAKAAGNVSFFWSGKPVSGGKLFVFDASGNIVTKLGVGGKDAKIGEWDLRGANGAPVAAGTYLAKGVLTTKGGAKEKVSFTFVVR